MQGKRRPRSLEVAGVSHSAPIPMGAIVGNMVFSSGIMGQDPKTGKLPADIEQQAEFAFLNMKTLVENAGGTLADIGKIGVFLKDNAHRQHVNNNWFKHFPDEHDRPARHIIVHDLPGGMLIQLEIIAVLQK